MADAMAGIYCGVRECGSMAARGGGAADRPDAADRMTTHKFDQRVAKWRMK